MILPLLVLGCVDTPKPVDTAAPCELVTFYADADGDGFGADADTLAACDLPDGYVEAAGDCDDGDLRVRPGGVEDCDGVDDDCDGEVDEDAVDPATWYADGDDDGYGDAAVATRACSAPAGHVADATDCDDADVEEHPGAPEVCDGDDDDCDFQVDEDDATDPLTWYADLDGDGYGDPTSPALACDEPVRHVANALDCDDGDGRVSPDATEVCDGEDDDCDGLVDDGAADAPTWYADTDGDGSGDATASLAECEAPEGYVADAADCDDTDAGISPDALEVCGGADEDCDGEIDEDDASDALPWYRDADGDTHGDATVVTWACTEPAGWSGTDGDCDDGSSSISPAATEICDLADTDEDCDGLADDDDPGATGTTTWYADADADGHGAAGTTATACDAPEGYDADADDCDDGAPTVHPGADEVCDEVDDDCDGLVDDADTDVVDAVAWYTDTDGDGWGDTAAGTACDAPAGTVASDGDCDDADADAHPGATETCAGAGDEDCDGAADETGAAGCTSFYADADADGYGSGAALCLCAADATHTATEDGDCDEADGAVNPGAEEVCDDGVDDDCSGADASCTLAGTLPTSTADAVITGAGVSAQAGQSVAGGGDLDADGYDDILVMARNTVYVAFGPIATSTLSDHTSRTSQESSNDQHGNALTMGPDFDGDGVSDWASSASASDRAGWTDGGAVYVVSGAPPAATTAADDAASWIFEGAASNDAFGTSIDLVESVDGDTYAELLVGATGDDSRGTNTGAAYLFAGSATGAAERSASTADAIVTGEARADQLGNRVAGGGDLDGDGVSDLLIGARGEGSSETGAIYLFTTPPTGTVSASTADAKITGTGVSDQLGMAFDEAGDLDGDGIDDLLLGVYLEDWNGMSSGAAYALAGGTLSGSLRLETSHFAQILGEATTDCVGYSVDGAGDVDGDGRRDVLVGAYNVDTGGTDAGAAGLFYGPLSGSVDFSDADALFLGTSANARIGAPVSRAGDTDADGAADLLVAGPGIDTPYTDAGAVWLWLGRAP